MSSRILDIMSFLTGITIGILFVEYFIVSPFSSSYKQGQIDALTGKIKYELVVKNDSTKVWKLIVHVKEK